MWLPVWVLATGILPHGKGELDRDLREGKESRRDTSVPGELSFPMETCKQVASIEPHP